MSTKTVWTRWRRLRAWIGSSLGGLRPTTKRRDADRYTGTTCTAHGSECTATDLSEWLRRKPRTRRVPAQLSGTPWLGAAVVLLTTICLSSAPLPAGAQFENLRCETLASLERFTIIATKSTDWRDLSLGPDVTVGSTDVPGTCNPQTRRCECPVLGCASAGVSCAADAECGDGTCKGGACACLPVPCEIAGKRCIGDVECMVGAPGICDMQSRECRCPELAPGCSAPGVSCAADDDCAVPHGALGHSTGGVCGNDVRVTRGNHMGPLVVRGDARFGRSWDCKRIVIESEFANTTNGRVRMSRNDPPTVAPVWLGKAGGRACFDDRACQRNCIAGRFLEPGRGPGRGSSSDGELGQGLDGRGTSLNFRLCDAAVLQLRATGSDQSFGPAAFQRAIENFVPAVGQRVILGASNCRSCPLVTTPDSGCGACSGQEMLRTRPVRARKIVVTLGGGLQVVDVPKVVLASKTVLELRGQRDTVAVIRIARDMRIGAQAKVVLGSNGTGNGRLQIDKLLWVARGALGHRLVLVRTASTFRGSLLATGRARIHVGAWSLVEGALWSRRVSVGVRSRVQHYPFSELMPLPGAGAVPFTAVGAPLRACSDSILAAADAVALSLAD